MTIRTEKLTDLELKKRIWDHIRSSCGSATTTALITEKLSISKRKAVRLLEEMEKTNNIRELFQTPPPDDEYRAWTTSSM